MELKLKRKKLDENSAAKAEGKDEGQVRAQKDVSDLNDREEPRESRSTGGDTPRRNEATEAGADNTSSDGKKSGRKITRSKLILLISTLLCLVLAAGGFLFTKFEGHFPLSTNGSQKLEPVTSIMRPIPMPDYREMTDFLIVYEVGGQKVITAVRMEIGYCNPTRYQNYKEQNVTVRDTVYAFLLAQNLPAISAKSWHSLVENDLLDFLRVKLPQSYPDKILLTQVENL